MNKSTSIFIIICLLFLFNCNRKVNNHKVEIISKIDSITTSLVKTNDFTGSILIAKNGEIILEKGYGFSNIENHIPNHPNTRFYLASLTKIFTIAAITNLHDKKLLKYTDTLSKYISDYPRGNEITIEHLLTHTSGIVDFINERNYIFKKQKISINEIIEEFKYLPLNFNPGQENRYSNSNFTLLAFIIEQVSGLEYAKFMEKEFFQKFNMTNSKVEMDSIPKNIATGYYKKNGEYTKGDYIHLSQFIGGGNISSNLKDMYKLYTALYKNGDISLNFQTGHFGEIPSLTRTAFLPSEERDFLVIILSNCGDTNAEEIGVSFCRILEKSII